MEIPSQLDVCLLDCDVEGINKTVSTEEASAALEERLT
jgi:hypothetical protein